MSQPTLVLVILDESGSMGIKRADVIGGFNEFLAKQKTDPSPCRIALTKFNTECSCKPVFPVAEVPELTDHSYLPGGNTALYDAIAQTVRKADAEKKADEKVLCLIMTDGEENSSRETTAEQVKQIIADRSGQGWTFLYIGEQPDKWQKSFGTANTAAVQYLSNNPRASLHVAEVATSAYRCDQAMAPADLLGATNL